MSPSVVADFADTDGMAHSPGQPGNIRILNRLEWLEHIVVEVQRLKGIRGETGASGMQGPPGKCDDAAIRQLEAHHKALNTFVLRLAAVVVVITMLVWYKVWWSKKSEPATKQAAAQNSQSDQNKTKK